MKEHGHTGLFHLLLTRLQFVASFMRLKLPLHLLFCNAGQMLSPFSYDSQHFHHCIFVTLCLGTTPSHPAATRSNSSPRYLPWPFAALLEKLPVCCCAAPRQNINVLIVLQLRSPRDAAATAFYLATCSPEEAAGGHGEYALTTFPQYVFVTL
jgi:hypothetical protein